MSAEPVRMNVGIHFDSHTHLHDADDADELFGAAFEVAARLDGPLVLALTDRSRCPAFASLSSGAWGGSGFETEPTAETESLRARSGEASVWLVAGRQFVTTEGLETLALGLRPSHALARISDRTRDAETLVGDLLASGAIVVLPWGVGKWLGPRGRCVARLALHAEFGRSPRLFLGDVPQRAWPWPRPALFDGPLRVLAGTDPLPLPGAVRGVARYRSVFRGAFDPARPFASILGLVDARTGFLTAGRRDRFVRAGLDQIRLWVGR